MRKPALLLLVLLLGLVAGCGDELTSPTPTPLPSPTPVPETATAAPTVGVTPSGPATCVAEPLDFPVVSGIPPVTEADHVHGPADAPITIIEYADFQCPGCAAMSTLRTYLEDAYGEDLQAVYRHFALSFHDKAIITGEAVEAAAAQGKFWEMHDLLYERKQEWEQLSGDAVQAKLIEYAEELGLDAERFAQELSEHVYVDRINADTQVAMQVGLPGTPTYIINGVVYPTQQLGLHPVPIGGFIQLMLLDQYTDVPPQVIDPEKGYVATIRAGEGDIVVELFADQAPINVNSFVFLARDGWYDEQSFFYVEPGGAAYGGDPTNMGWSFPYPGYYCGDEISPDVTFDEPGMLALFTPSPGRNSSMFFITYAPLPDFDGKFTIIGRIVEGMEVAESLTPTQPGSGQPSSNVIETILVEER